MKALDILARTCWHEFRAGVTSGIVSFTFAGLTLYLALSLTSAEYMQTLGATDVPRNAAAVIYLMVTGFMFFLFFAWAWIFSQPILRDRSVSLHEIVLTAPVNLRLLMCGRYFGACLLGIVLSCSVLCGFFIAPLLELAGWLPPGSFSATPWSQFGFSLLWLIIPPTMGVGALYMVAAILSRSIAGPLAASVCLILVWMFCAVTLTEGDVNVVLAGVLDPSLFSFTLAETDLWAPEQKASALLPLRWDFLANRLIWGGLPLLVFASVLWRLDRERLVSNVERSEAQTIVKSPAAARERREFVPALKPSQNWLRILMRECGWQLTQLAQSRALWVGAVILLCVGLSNAFIHIIWHAEGPLLPDPNLLVREINTSLYLVVIFILAGVVGLISRRDSVPGVEEMLDGLSAPASLRLFARAIAVFVSVLALALVPGLAAVLATLIAEPSFLDLGFIFACQILIVAPAQLEAAMLVFFIHALIRRTGLAYGVSMFVVLLLVLNHELELTSFPPFEVGIPARIAFSPLTGWEPWLDYSAMLGAYKLAFCLFLMGAAALVLPRGLNSRRQLGGDILRERMLKAPGLISLISLISLGSTFWILNTQLVWEGGYKSAQESQAVDALWEQLWSGDGGDLGFATQGGDIRISINAAQREIAGHWQVTAVTAPGELLYAQAPEGLVNFNAFIDGRRVPVQIQHDLIAVPLGACAAQGCDVELDWTVQQRGWPNAAEAPFITRAGIWAHASQIAPVLGIDPERILRSEARRYSHGLKQAYDLPKRAAAPAVSGVAPAAAWSWHIDYDAGALAYDVLSPVSGKTSGALDFSIFGGREIETRPMQGISVYSAAVDETLATRIATDAQDMQRCVARRLNSSRSTAHIVRWPQGRGISHITGPALALAEAPYWHINSDGAGHLMRRAHIAYLMARQYIVNAAALRQEPGSIFLTDGIAGALGLLCVGDVDGIAALSQLLARYSELTTKALASTAIPVGPLKDAIAEGWARHYAAQAALAWVAGQSPESLNAFLMGVPRSRSIESALKETYGADFTRITLGTPWRTTLQMDSTGDAPQASAQRHRWENGAWRKADMPANLRALVSSESGITLTDIPTSDNISADSAPQQLLIIDDWSSYGTGAAFFPSNQ